MQSGNLGAERVWSCLVAGTLVLVAVCGCSTRSRSSLSTDDSGSDELRRCGNQRCDPGETCDSCSSDCGTCDGSSAGGLDQRDSGSLAPPCTHYASPDGTGDGLTEQNAFRIS